MPEFRMIDCAEVGLHCAIEGRVLGEVGKDHLGSFHASRPRL